MSSFIISSGIYWAPTLFQALPQTLRTQEWISQSSSCQWTLSWRSSSYRSNCSWLLLCTCVHVCVCQCVRVHIRMCFLWFNYEYFYSIFFLCKYILGKKISVKLRSPPTPQLLQVTVGKQSWRTCILKPFRPWWNVDLAVTSYCELSVSTLGYANDLGMIKMAFQWCANNFCLFCFLN